MAKITDIIAKLEKIAPLQTQEEWDNSGWQVDLGIKTAKKALIALDVTEETVNQAIKANCDLIISHHPVFFNPIKCVKNKAVIKAIQNNIQIYSVHTCFDKAEIGTTQTLTNLLAQTLKSTDIRPINDFTNLIKLSDAVDVKTLINKIKKSLKLKTVKIANPTNSVKTIAVCAGAGAEFIAEAKKHNAQCYITADIKYHQARESKLMLVDIGHFESEVIALKSLQTALKSTDLEIILSKETPIFEIL